MPLPSHANRAPLTGTPRPPYGPGIHSNHGHIVAILAAGCETQDCYLNSTQRIAKAKKQRLFFWHRVGLQRW